MIRQKRPSRVIAGRKAQSQGAAFEALFLHATARNQITATRIPDGCKQLPNKRIIRIKAPFDWALSYKGKSALIDTKTIEKPRFPHSLIEIHQALTLLRHHNEGTTAGYIVWLREPDQVIFINAKLLCIFLQKPGSIGVDTDGIIPLGPMTNMDIARIFNDNSSI